MLFEQEVPEIYEEQVRVVSVVRDPGYRAKVAVTANEDGIDAVGTCVGVRGARVQAIVRELKDEKIDIIAWDEDARVFITNALNLKSEVVRRVELNEAANSANVVVADDQLSLAIGRRGQNARLAAKLTGWHIDIKSESEAPASLDTLFKENVSETEDAESEDTLFKENVSETEDAESELSDNTENSDIEVEDETTTEIAEENDTSENDIDSETDKVILDFTIHENN